MLDLPDLAATHRLGRALAQFLARGEVIALQGPLGSGKSELARAIIRVRAGSEIDVPSPTFTLIQPYPFDDLPLWHIDLYRLGSADEAYELGLGDIAAEGALLIEWPERLADDPLLDQALWIVLSDNAGHRRARLHAPGPWQQRLAALAKRHA